MRAIAGLVVIMGVAWLLSERRGAIHYRPVIAGFALQALLAVVLIRLPASLVALRWAARGADAFQHATEAGTGLVFGYLGGAAPPFATGGAGSPYILAFRGLPLVLTISALASVLYYWGVMQRVAGAIAWVLRRTMGLSGPLALAAALHVFVGMVEAPLLVRPYLARMSRGELFALMSCGMAGIAGTVMVIYAGLLGGVVGNPLGALLAASVISTPAALAIAALMVPFDPGPRDPGALALPHAPVSTLDAIVRGAMDGVPVLVGIVVMLIVAVAAVSLVNDGLGLLPGAVTLQGLAALPLRPVMWLIGVPWRETGAAALLMATKTILNEFVAYIDLSHLPPAALSPRSRLIVTYALCGFANVGSLGIMVGGLAPMLPEDQRGELARLAARSVLSGTLATCMSGAWAGLLAG